MTTLALGLNQWAAQLDLLHDVIETQTNVELERRLGEFESLYEACAGTAHLVLGGTVTLVRRNTRETFSVGVGFTTAPLSERDSSLLSWQFGFWCDSADHQVGTVSSRYALPAEAGSLIVLEELRPAAEADLRIFIAGSSMTDRAFVSYVRENTDAVDRLCGDLGGRGVATWKDRENLEPGQRWKDVIRTAIQGGSAFVACFSSAFLAREKSYMNEELLTAVEDLRLRHRDRSWFFPVLLDDVEVPAIPIGPGETLRDLQLVSLAADWTAGVDRLARAIRGSGAPAGP